MGSITTYSVKKKSNNIIEIEYECEGDMGETNDGIAVSFKNSHLIETLFPLIEGQCLRYQKVDEIRKFLKLRDEILKEEYNNLLKEIIETNNSIWKEKLDIGGEFRQGYDQACYFLKNRIENKIRDLRLD